MANIKIGDPDLSGILLTRLSCGDFFCFSVENAVCVLTQRIYDERDRSLTKVCYRIVGGDDDLEQFEVGDSTTEVYQLDIVSAKFKLKRDN